MCCWVFDRREGSNWTSVFCCLMLNHCRMMIVVYFRWRLFELHDKVQLWLNPPVCVKKSELSDTSADIRLSQMYRCQSICCLICTDIKLLFWEIIKQEKGHFKSFLIIKLPVKLTVSVILSLCLCWNSLNSSEMFWWCQCASFSFSWLGDNIHHILVSCGSWHHPHPPH